MALLIGFGRALAFKTLKLQTWSLHILPSTAALCTKPPPSKKVSTKHVGETIISTNPDEAVKLTDEDLRTFLARKTSISFPQKAKLPSLEREPVFSSTGGVSKMANEESSSSSSESDSSSDSEEEDNAVRETVQAKVSFPRHTFVTPGDRTTKIKVSSSKQRKDNAPETFSFKTRITETSVKQKGLYDQTTEDDKLLKPKLVKQATKNRAKDVHLKGLVTGTNASESRRPAEVASKQLKESFEKLTEDAAKQLKVSHQRPTEIATKQLKESFKKLTEDAAKQLKVSHQRPTEIATKQLKESFKKLTEDAPKQLKVSHQRPTEIATKQLKESFKKLTEDAPKQLKVSHQRPTEVASKQLEASLPEAATNQLSKIQSDPPQMVAQNVTLLSQKETEIQEIETQRRAAAAAAAAAAVVQEELLNGKGPVVELSMEEMSQATGIQTEQQSTIQEAKPAAEVAEEAFDISSYKNLQHHEYTPYTFVDYDVDLSKFRLPQPSSGRLSPRH